MLLAGIRPSECDRLTWADVTADALWVLGKNGKRRPAELNPEASSMFEAMRLEAREAGTAGPRDKVFGSRPNNSTFDADLQRARIQKYDNRGRPASMTSFRKTLATTLEQAGVPEVVASQIMRHSHVQTTRKHYTDIQRTAKQAAIGQLSHVSHRDFFNIGAEKSTQGPPDGDDGGVLDDCLISAARPDAPASNPSKPPRGLEPRGRNSEGATQGTLGATDPNGVGDGRQHNPAGRKAGAGFSTRSRQTDAAAWRDDTRNRHGSRGDATPMCGALLRLGPSGLPEVESGLAVPNPPEAGAGPARVAGSSPAFGIIPPPSPGPRRSGEGFDPRAGGRAVDRDRAHVSPSSERPNREFNSPDGVSLSLPGWADDRSGNEGATPSSPVYGESSNNERTPDARAAYWKPARDEGVRREPPVQASRTSDAGSIPARPVDLAAFAAALIAEWEARR